MLVKYGTTKLNNLNKERTDEFYRHPFQKGTKAPQAAGRIHTDFEKGFIMAEVMKFEDFRSEGSENACKVMITQTFDDDVI